VFEFDVAATAAIVAVVVLAVAAAFSDESD
jgi:hypothetical protein